MKFLEGWDGVGRGPATNRLDVSGNPNHDPDLGFLDPGFLDPHHDLDDI